MTNQLKDGRWEAQVGLIKMTLEEKEFDLVQAQKEAPVKKKQVNVVKRAAGKGPQARLDLRGKRYEEAMEALDAFIDQACSTIWPKLISSMVSVQESSVKG